MEENNAEKPKLPEVKYSGLELHQNNGYKIYMAVSEAVGGESFVFSSHYFNDWFPQQIVKRAECFYSYAIYNIAQHIKNEGYHLDFGIKQYFGGAYDTFSDRIIVYLDNSKEKVEKVIVYTPGYKTEFPPEIKSGYKPDILSEIDMEKLTQNYQLYMAEAKIPAHIKQYYLDALAMIEEGIKLSIEKGG